MRLFLISIVVLAAVVPMVPGALAHQCASGTPSSSCACPVPDDGQYHQHSSPSGSCQGGPGGSQSATPGGASQQVPASGAVLVVGVVGALALLIRGRAA